MRERLSICSSLPGMNISSPLYETFTFSPRVLPPPRFGVVVVRRPMPSSATRAALMPSILSGAEESSLAAGVSSSRGESSTTTCSAWLGLKAAASYRAKASPAEKTATNDARDNASRASLALTPPGALTRTGRRAAQKVPRCPWLWRRYCCVTLPPEEAITRPPPHEFGG